jgi:hypothetical protein
MRWNKPVKTNSRLAGGCGVLLLSGLVAVNVWAAGGNVFEAQFATAMENVKSAQGAAFEREFQARMRPLMAPAEQRCKEKSGDRRPKPYRAVVTLANDGKAQSALVSPETPYTRCIAGELAGIRWPRPPSAPYQSAIDFD